MVPWKGRRWCSHCEVNLNSMLSASPVLLGDLIWGPRVVISSLPEVEASRCWT